MFKFAGLILCLVMSVAPTCEAGVHRHIITYVPAQSVETAVPTTTPVTVFQWSPAPVVAVQAIRTAPTYVIRQRIVTRPYRFGRTTTVITSPVILP